MRLRTQLLISLLAGSALGLLISLLLPAGNFLNSWLAGSLLGIPAAFGLIAAWRFGAQVGSGRMLGWLVGLAFALRLGLGIFFALALPDWGYDQPAQNAGYIYSDAHTRDTLAWQLTVEGQPVTAAFQQSIGDQYGGLLALSTLTYRLLSPDAHRAWLILVMAAFAAAAGVPFLWRGLRSRFGDRVAKAAVWLFALYPESVLLGSSQMREPFLIGLSGIALWAVLDGSVAARKRWMALAAALAFGALLSPPAGLLLGLLSIGWVLLERINPRGNQRWVFWGVLGLGIAAALALLWNWFWLAAQWDSYLAERASGWIQLLSKQLSPAAMRLFLTGYGLVQPVLPATIFEPAIPIMQAVSILRALGWYLLAPFLVYGICATWKAEPGAGRRALVWTACLVLAWSVISSLRAGGDMWDNPRYRTLTLAWMALLAAWGWQYARQSRSRWLKRSGLIAILFVAGFTFWYMGRYIPGLIPVHVLVILGIVALASLLVLAFGWWADRKIPRAQK